MVVTVIVTGVPRLMSLKNLAVEFNEVLDDEDIGDFRVRDVKNTCSNSSKRLVALDFESSFDAMTVQEKLDGFIFVTSGGSTNILKAKIWTASDEPEPSSEVVISTTSRKDYYEQSVEDVNESLNMHIDLIKKQTLALKAQRKLLREQKKLRKEYTKLDTASDDETHKKHKSRKRKRLKSKESSDSVDRSKSRDKHSSPKLFDRHKRSRSRTCDDYLAIEYKKISTTRRSKSPEARKRLRSVARSKSREKPPRKSDPYKRRSRSRSCENYSAVEYNRSKNVRKSNSPKRQFSPRRIVRSKSRERHRSPRRISESYQRRSRSRSREKYYSVETIKYKKALLTISPKSKSKYERTEHCVLTSKSSKLLRSPSPYKGDLRSKIDSYKRKLSRSRSPSRSPFKRKLILTDSRSKYYKNRSPSNEKKLPSPYGKPQFKYSKSELISSDIIDVKRKASKATGERKSHDQEDLFKLNAEIQSKKRQAMDDVLFEMEFLLRKQRNNIKSNADNTFLTNLVKGIVKSRFQKLEVHNRMMVSDIVTHYRSHYSKEDDRTLLRNLAEECKSLDEVTSTVVADSTAEVPDPQSQNDEIWTAVDEVLDGVDLDLLQAEPEPNEVEINENPENKSQISEREETATVNSKNAVVPNDFEETQINSTSETVITEINTDYVSTGPEQAKSVIMAKHKAMNLVKLISDLENTNESITSSGLPIITNPKVNYYEDTKENAIEDDITSPKELNNKDTKVADVIKVKTELIELSEDSDNEVVNSKQFNETSTKNQAHIDNSFCHIIEVKSLVEVGKPIARNSILTPVRKVWTVDLTEETDETEQNNDNDHIKKENMESNMIDSTTNPNQTDINNDQSDASLSHANLLNYIKREKIEMDSIIISDDDDIGTNYGQCNNNTFDQNVKSIKQEQVASDEDTICGNRGFYQSIILSSIKQEPGTTEIDQIHLSDKPKTNEAQSQYTIPDKNILRSIKKEREPTVTEELTHCAAADSEINENTPNTNIPLTISHCLKQENDAKVNNSLKQSDMTNDQIKTPKTINSSGIIQEYLATDSTSQSEVTNINNEQVTMPVPFVVRSVKQENITFNSTAKIQSDIKDNNDDQINMPRPIKSSDIKQEDVATDDDFSNQIKLNNINNDLILHLPNIKTIIKHEEIETDNSFLKSHCNTKECKNDKVIMPVQIIEMSKKKVNVAAVNIDSINILSSSINRPFKSAPKERIERKEKQSSLKQNNKIDGSDSKDGDSSKKTREKKEKHKKKKEKRIKHKRETESSIKKREKEESCSRNEERNSSMKKEKQCLTNPTEIKTNINVSKTSQNVINKQLELQELSNKTEENDPSNVKEQNVNINTRLIPKNPQFVVPTHIIMRQFKSLIKNDYNEHKYMYKITQKVLRDRFTELVKDKGYVKAREIVKMYRDCYKEKYEEFLGGIAADIKSGKYDGEIRKIAIEEMEKQNQTTSKKK